MTERKARETASGNAKRKQVEYFVVWSVEESDIPSQHYQVSNESDLEGFLLGCEVVACFGPDGGAM
jgi:hypothetical protein